MTREMIDSGIEWIGEIPSNWKTSRIGSEFKVRNQKVSDKDYMPLSVTKLTEGIVPQMDQVAKSDAHDDRKLVLKGDFVINSRSDRKMSCGVSNYDGSVSLINIVLEPVGEILPNYTHYLLKNYAFAEEFYKWGHGIVADLWTTNSSDLKRITVSFPNIEEQQKIVKTLDKKISQIDKLIANQEKQIEKLNSYKKSIISRTITNGLEDSAEMIYSGIKEIGNIPSTWTAQKILYQLSMPITDGPHTTPNLYDEGVAFVSAEAVSCGNGTIDFSHIRGYVSEEFYEECCKKYIPEIDDIYMIKSGATTGRVGMVTTLEPKFTIWSPLAVMRTNRKKMIPKFLYYAVQTYSFQKQVEFGWSFGTQQNLGMRTLEQLKVVVPSFIEQEKIVDYLDKRCDGIDRLITIKQSKIEKLKEYKKSIIYEYATGKKVVL